MKRRTFLTRVAAPTLFGPASGLAARETGAHGASAQAMPSTRQHQTVATPIARIEPQRAALLVMDYQPAWIRTIPESDALLDRAVEAIDAARAAGVRVAYTRVAFTAADYAAVPPGNIIFTQLTSEPGALDDDSPATAMDDRVAPEPGDKVVRKTRVSAFARTDLDGWLRALDIDTLLLAGISTSGVVLSTVCDAADRDYRVIVLADACADRDAEIQDVLIHKIFPQRAQVGNVAGLSDLLRSMS